MASTNFENLTIFRAEVHFIQILRFNMHILLLKLYLKNSLIIHEQNSKEIHF